MIATESWVRIWSCCSLGKTSMIRLTVPSAELVCRVPKTMCPVSAAVIGRLDRGQVAHFADQDDVGVHPQGAADRLGEVGDVDADLALIDQRLLVLVVVLDRVFDRDDVAVHVVVDPVDHATPGWSSCPSRSGRSPGSGRGAAGSTAR